MRFVIMLVAGLTALVVAGCSVPSDVGGISTGAGGPTRFEVTGSGTAQNVTWGTNGGQSQEAKSKLPWSKEVPSASAGTAQVASLVAQNSGSGSISCKISRGGKVVAEQTSTGQYAVVTCAG